MIKNIKVTNHLGESITFELRFPEKSGFLIRDGTDGLGPSKANINTTEKVMSDGAVYNSSRVTKRNIILSLGFIENPTIEDTRQLSYKYFPLNKRVEIEVETDNRVCKTFGYIESNEPDIFSSAEGCIVSVICPDSYFSSLYKNITIFSGTDPLFEFPFSSEMAQFDSFDGMAMGVLALSHTIDIETVPAELIEFGNILTSTKKSIVYIGDATVGMMIYIHAIGPVVNLKITNPRTRELMSINSAKLVALTGSGVASRP